jgi:hypothetical protein
MSKFRGKPVEIEATQWFKEGDHEAVALYYFASGPAQAVTGAQGKSRVDSGDWIIREPSGNGFYPCKPSVFALKYEPVE